MSEETRRRDDEIRLREHLLLVQTAELGHWRDRFDEQRERLQEVSQERALLRDLLRLREADLAVAGAETRHLRQELSNRSEQLACRELELSNLHQTLSWRLTAPLRWLSANLGRR
jgi:predicted nuclease with TOPRIM domain